MWSLIRSPAASGAWNMALDEAILESVGAGIAPPTLRIYAWSPPCLSLGYAQPFSQIDRRRSQEYGWEIVRRPTGGRAILHMDELTYSISLPIGDRHVHGGVLESYRYLSMGLVSSLRRLGLQVEIQPEIKSSPSQRSNPICFELPSSYEITAGGKKLIGSAQLRRKGGVLQHGSLPLHGDIARICLALTFADEEQRQEAMQRTRQRATTMEASLGKRATWEKAAAALQSGFSQALKLRFEERVPSAEELRRSQQLCEERYTDRAWTERV